MSKYSVRSQGLLTYVADKRDVFMQAKTRRKKPTIVKSIREINDPVKGLDPLVNIETSILILGTFPGQDSLTKSEYYADSSNRFWPTISDILGIYETDYNIKTRCLLDSGTGTWDIFAYVQRKGSSDRGIEKGLYCDIIGFLIQHRHIKNIAFNGKNARDWLQQDMSDVFKEYSCKRLQSTSGNNGHFNHGEDWKNYF